MTILTTEKTITDVKYIVVGHSWLIIYKKDGTVTDVKLSDVAKIEE